VVNDDMTVLSNSNSVASSPKLIWTKLEDNVFEHIALGLRSPFAAMEDPLRVGRLHGAQRICVWD